MIPGTFTSITRTASDIQFIGKGARTVRNGNGSITPPVHADTVSGDYVIALYQWDQDSSADTPAGWTELAYRNEGDFEVRAIGKIYAGTPPTITLTSGGDQLIGACVTFRYVNSSNPVDGANTEANFSVVAGTGNECGSVTTTVANCMVLNMLGHDYNTSSSVIWSDWANPDLENMQEFVEYSTTSGWDGGFALAGGIKRTAGAVSNTTFTSAVNKDICWLSFALRPE